MDKMYINDLLISCIIGTNPDERIHKQDLLVNIVLECDLSKAGASDKLEDTINYHDLTNRISELAANSSFFLIEKMAETLAELCLCDTLVNAVSLRIDKPAAIEGARAAAVEICRYR